MVCLLVAGCSGHRTDMAHTTAPGLLKASAISFTSEQAGAGSQEYQMHCTACHGAQMEGGAGPALAGPNAKKLLTTMHATVGDIFSVMTTEMPINAPASLSHDQYVEIISYILQRNGYEPDGKPLTFEAAGRSRAPLAPAKEGPK